MSSATSEQLRPASLQEEMDATANILLAAYGKPDIALSEVTAIEYTTRNASQEADGLTFVFTLHPNNRTAVVRFPFGGEMHGMNFRFKRGKLENADRTTNGFQESSPEYQKWLKGLLEEVKTGGTPDSTIDFRFNTVEPVAFNHWD